MFKFLVIHGSASGIISVDVFNSRRHTVSPWRVYWTVSPSSRARLRAVYQKDPHHVFFFRGWSELRVQAYQRYGRDIAMRAWARSSLDSLSTSGRQNG